MSRRKLDQTSTSSTALLALGSRKSAKLAKETQAVREFRRRASLALKGHSILAQGKRRRVPREAYRRGRNNPQHAPSRIGLDHVRWLVWLLLGWTYWLGSEHAPQPEPKIREPHHCAQCGCAMRIARVLHTNCRALVEHCCAYLDCG